MVDVDPAKLALAITSGVFDPEDAAAFLKCPTVEAFNRVRRRYKMKGLRVGQEWRYSREMLETLRKTMFGMDCSGGRRR
jgi:hypothetical protein